MTHQRVPNSQYGVRFMTVFPEVLAAIARDRSAPGDALRVLMWCWDKLSHQQWRALRQVEVGGELGISQSSVAASLKFLLEHEMVERRGAGPRQEWRLSPEGSWVGYAGEWHKAKRTRGQPELRVVGKPGVLVTAGEGGGDVDP